MRIVNVKQTAETGQIVWKGEVIVRGHGRVPVRFALGNKLISCEIHQSSRVVKRPEGIDEATVSFRDIKGLVAPLVDRYFEPILKNEDSLRETLKTWAQSYDTETGMHEQILSMRASYGSSLITSQEIIRNVAALKRPVFSALAWLARKGKMTVVKDQSGKPLGWQFAEES